MLKSLFRIFRWLVALALLVFLITLGLLCLWESQVKKTWDSTLTADAIIVLGAQVKPDGTPSVQLQWRLEAAAEAWRHYPVPVIVCGARGKDEPEPEAVVMKRVLIASGVPEESIYADPDSVNTRQNLRNAADILDDLHIGNRVLIVSSDYHVPRAAAMARDEGLEAVTLGSPCIQEYWLKNNLRETLKRLKYWGIKSMYLPLD